MSHPQTCQSAWYKYVEPWVKDSTVLDVGAADGNGMRIMRDAGATHVVGIDKLPLHPDVSFTPIEDIQTRSFDVVTAMDVIEHVEQDEYFFDDLVRIAKFHVFFTTPNWNRFHCANEYHVREYTPEELLKLIAGFSSRIFLADDSWNIVECPILRDDERSANFGVLIEL